ncbi:hypothetical protein AX15_004269 [Amanita polypyramis BW_CC]|nr:hypothetical protein AX15_004269 [Amanita polypyramis BW_CC]
MSDSGDDLGGFAPLTPHLPQKRTVKARTNGKANARTATEAGPSRPPRASRAVARKRATTTRNKVSPTNDDNNSDVQEVQESEGVEAETANAEDEDVQMVDVSKGGKGVSSSGTTGLNAYGKSGVKGKGKARVAKAKKLPLETDAIDVDAVEEDEEIEDEMNYAAQETSRALLNKKDKELAKLQEKFRRSQEQVQSLMEKLEETHRIRETEAEKVLKALNEQFQLEVKSKEALIEALTAQLAQKEMLALRGKDSILHMITREAADEEQRKLASDIVQCREALKEKEQELREKDNQIAESHQIENELRFELKTEIERSKALSDKSLRMPQMASRSRVGGVAFEDPKNTEVIRFYEDLTNLLVTSMKHQASHRPGADEWTLKCIYTYSDDDISTDSLQQKSVAFTLRTTFPSKSDSDSDPNEQSIHYTPDDLDKEPPDFVDKLGFLNQPFTFSRRQLSLFLRTLYDNLKEALTGESGQEDDEVQIVEK